MVPAMGEGDVQGYRRQRLTELLDRHYAGNKSELGRALGLKSGAFVRQMIDGERPITEKTVTKIKGLRGGRFATWFDSEPAPPVYEWPFDLLSRELWEGLTERQKGAVELGALRVLAKIRPEVERLTLADLAKPENVVELMEPPIVKKPSPYTERNHPLRRAADHKKEQ